MVNVISLSYIDLPTTLMMATHGVEVMSTDYNKKLVATLNADQTTFKEETIHRVSISTDVSILRRKSRR